MNTRTVTLLGIMIVGIVAFSHGGSIEHPPKNWFIQGKVITVIEDEGMLIKVTRNKAVETQQPGNNVVVLVRGKFSDVADEEPVACTAIPDGKYRHAGKTVRAFRFVAWLGSE